jgi:hypothetical protein
VKRAFRVSIFLGEKYFRQNRRQNTNIQGMFIKLYLAISLRNLDFFEDRQDAGTPFLHKSTKKYAFLLSRSAANRWQKNAIIEHKSRVAANLFLLL